MLKAVVGIIVIGFVFFIFYDSTPKYITFDGVQYGPRAIDKSNDSKSTLYRFNSPAADNSDYLLLLKPNSGTGDIRSWSNIFVPHFERQGFKFERLATKNIGLRSDEVMYLLESEPKNIILMYMVKGGAPPTSIDASGEVFKNMANITF